MTNRFTGGVISATAPTVSQSSASGVWNLEEAQYYQKAGTWPDGSGADPYFKYNTLLLHGDGTNGAQNNTFLDSSTNNFTITRNGNTTQGSFDPYVGPGCWSNFYATTSSGWQTPANTVTGVLGSTFNSTATFTVEAWIYPLSRHSGGGAVLGYVFGSMNLAGSNADWTFGPDSNGNLVTFWYQGGNQICKGGSVIPLNTWTHVALVVTSGAIKMYVNGVQETTTGPTSITLASQTLNYVSSGGYLYAGTTWQGFNGYISNMRVVGKRAVYSTNFTPSTTPLVATTDTTLLVNNQNQFGNLSASNYALTVTGGIQVSKFSPFTFYQTTPASYSGYFDGNGDYLSVAYGAGLSLVSGDFTIEGWFYCTALTAGAQQILNKDGVSGSSYTQYAVYITSAGVVSGELGNGNGTSPTSTVYSSGITASLNTWTHFALVRTGTTIKLFVNGVQGISQAQGVAMSEGSKPLLIGYQTAQPANQYFNGSISNVRILKGTALYTANFTPPTSPLTAIANTQLLTCQSTTFIDNSTNAFTITANGNATPVVANPFTGSVTGPTPYSTTTYGGSMYFDGNGDYLTIPGSSSFNLSSGAWTLEVWVYITTSKTATIISEGEAVWRIQLNASNVAAWVFNTSSSQALGTLKPNSWNHLAICCDGTGGATGVKAFLNGTLQSTGQLVPPSDSSSTIYIGRNPAATAPAWDFNGYISGLRLIKGSALYTRPFVPPIAPPTPVSGTQLLTNATNGGIFDNTTINDLETVGNAQISTSVVKYGTGSIAFDGTGDYLTAPSNTALALGTGDFTAECWVYLTTNASLQSIFNINQYTTGILVRYDNSTNGYCFFLGGTQYNSSVTTVGQWIHLAVTRSSSTVRFFVNGTQTNSATNAYNVTGATFVAGTAAHSITETMTGYIDDLRITKGYARYTANFTPPAAAFPNF